MNIYNKGTIKRFCRQHPECTETLLAWYNHVSKADWKTPHDIKKMYPKASIIGGGSKNVVFDILGGNYRLIASANYSRQWVFVKWFGTHSQYDKIDVSKL